jgi:RHH-type proline utilization regulon transcriptional repressor/proline dehydrogenase/delta 1-pyrroline-5-carboxylate dehydrogenase
LLERLIDAARLRGVGPAEEPSTAVPPVIDRLTFDYVQQSATRAKHEVRCLLETDTRPLAEQTGGYYVGPTILADIPPAHVLARDGLPGPVLVVVKVADLDEAIRVFNSGPQALAGGICSRSPSHIEAARAQCQCDTFYINRPLGSGRIGRPPSRGFKLAGIDSRASGPDYLAEFCRSSADDDTPCCAGAPHAQMSATAG